MRIFLFAILILFMNNERAFFNSLVNVTKNVSVARAISLADVLQNTRARLPTVAAATLNSQRDRGERVELVVRKVKFAR